MKLWLKAFLLNSLLLTALAIFILLAVRQVVTSSLRIEQTRQGLIIAHNLADRLADLVLLEDSYPAEKIIEATLASEESLFYVFVVGMNEKIFVHSFGTQQPADLTKWNPTGTMAESVQLLATEAGIIRDVGVKIFEGLPAEIHVGLQETRIEKAQLLIRNRIILGSAAAILCAWLLSSLFSHLLNRPLSRLVAHTEQLAQGNFGGRVDFPVSGEFKELAATIDTLSQELALFQQRTEDSFQQMLRAEKLSALGRLSAGLAHELRNPLTSIKILFQSFQDSSPPTPQDISVVLTEAQRMEVLLKRFLAFTRIEETELTQVNVNDLVEHVLKISRFQLLSQHIRVEMSLDAVSSVRADKAMLEQVLLNLVMNAIEVMPDGGVLGVATKQYDSQIEFQVSDSGGGIPEDLRKKIFDPFFTTKSEGTGLGLSVSHNIISHFGGIIDCRCEDDGTVFFVRLPMAKAG